MDIKDLDKKQLILLTLLITFVVSIATGIITVSLMSQMPKNVPQTINNVIQRTIEKVTTVETPTKDVVATENQEVVNLFGGEDAVVPIYQKNTEINTPQISENTGTLPVEQNTNTTDNSNTKELGQGIILSDVGLILVETSILNENLVYRVVLNKKDFDATILKKFNNGFTVLKISEKKDQVKTTENTNTTKKTQ